MTLVMPFRVGDRLDRDGQELEVTGVVVGGYDPTRPVDETTEYLLVRRASGQEKVWSVDDLPAGLTTLARGPGLFDDVESVELGPGWVARFADLVESRPGEPALARAVAERSERQTILTGGTVRDGLRGGDRREGDLDLAGTLRSCRFREIVDGIFTELFHGRPSTSNRRWEYTTSPEQFVTVESYEPHHAVDYAPLRHGHRAHELSGGPVWVYGSTLRADVEWRDLTCNTVVLDLLPDGRGTLYDPTGRGLLDLGLASAQLRGDPTGAPLRELCLRPIDLPPDAPLRHAAIHLVRVIDHLARFADHGAVTTPIGAWAAAHQDVLLAAAEHREGGSAEPLVVKELMTTRRAEAVRWARGHQEELKALLGPELGETILGLMPRSKRLRSLGGARGLRLHGVALQVVRQEDGELRFGDVVGPSRPTAAAAAAFFGDDLVGYEHQVLEVDIGEGGPSPLLGLVPVDRDGVTYLELDGSLQPITCTEEQLVRWRAEDG